SERLEDMDEALREVVDTIVECVQLASTAGTEMFVAGAQKMATVWEDASTMSRVLEILQREAELMKIIAGASALTVQLGTEMLEHEPLDMAVVSRTFDASGEAGSVGVIGPMRMNYRRAISAVEEVSRELESQIGPGAAGWAATTTGVSVARGARLPRGAERRSGRPPGRAARTGIPAIARPPPGSGRQPKPMRSSPTRRRVAATTAATQSASKPSSGASPASTTCCGRCSVTVCSDPAREGVALAAAATSSSARRSRSSWRRSAARSTSSTPRGHAAPIVRGPEPNRGPARGHARTVAE